MSTYREDIHTNMEASMTVEKTSRLQSKEVAGKKRNVASTTTELPKKISASTIDSSGLVPTVVPSTSVDPRYKFTSPRLVTVGSPVTLFVVGEPPRFPFNAGGPHFMIPQPPTADTNANNNGIQLLLSPPITTMPTSVTQDASFINSVTTKNAQLAQLGSDDNSAVARSLREFQESPLDVDEHFRRSLANLPGYGDSADKNPIKSTKSDDSQNGDEKMVTFQHSDIMPAPETVDDHFARALGKEWLKLTKLKESENSN